MPQVIERPEMSLKMWTSLKRRIMKEREKKKEEEADAAIKQMQREQEIKRKEDAMMTLKEINEESAQLERKLEILKEEKQEMFMKYKKVLNEEKRRHIEDKEASEFLQIGHRYLTQNVPVTASNLYMNAGNRVMSQNAAVYKVGTDAAQQQNVSIERRRSPSPPPNNYQRFGYKTQHVPPYGQPYPIPHSSNSYASHEQSKHLASGYYAPHLPPGYVSNLPPHIDHPPHRPTNSQEEKYFIQAGGISVGYPIHTQQQGASHFQQPSTSRSVATPIQLPLRKEGVMRRNMNNEEHRTS